MQVKFFTRDNPLGILKALQDEYGINGYRIINIRVINNTRIGFFKTGKKCYKCIAVNK